MSQEFNTPVSIKLSLHFQDIFDCIFSHPKVEGLVNYEASDVKAIFDEDKKNQSYLSALAVDTVNLTLQSQSKGNMITVHSSYQTYSKH